MIATTRTYIEYKMLDAWMWNVDYRWSNALYAFWPYEVVVNHGRVHYISDKVL